MAAAGRYFIVGVAAARHTVSLEMKMLSEFLNGLA
jgi:hypothetical protein